MRTLCALLLFLGACVSDSSLDEQRPGGIAGKGDAPGQCTADTCGGPGVGQCFCDEACVENNDCCSNYGPVCLGEEPPSGVVPEFGNNPQIAVVANASHGLDSPKDLAFHNLRSDQLYIVNQADNSCSVIEGFGTPEASISTRSGPGSQHFLAKPSAIAFGADGLFATAQEENQITQPTTPADFMGPTLWTSDLSIFDGGHQGHVDMLHNSPSGAGIAHVAGNAYFVFDGAHDSLTFYDFQGDHGPGGADHSDGIVRRYAEGAVSYVPGVPSHLEMSAGKLYVADTGNNRIAVLDPQTGSLGPAITPNYDGSDQRQVVGASLDTLIDGASANLQAPSGLAIHLGRLFVGDASTGEIVAFDLASGAELGRLDTGGSGLAGITIGPDGHLYFANSTDDLVGHVIPGQ